MLDLHAGGKTLDFVPFAAAHRLSDKDQETCCVAAYASNDLIARTIFATVLLNPDLGYAVSNRLSVPRQ